MRPASYFPPFFSLKTNKLIKVCTRFVFRLGYLLLVSSLIIMPGSAQSGTSTPAWQTKVDREVLSAVAKGETEFILYLSEQADLSDADKFLRKTDKGEYVFQQLAQLAVQTQGSILAELDSLGVDHQPFWIANMIWVRGDLPVLTAMASRDDVARIYANPKVQMEEPTKDSLTQYPQRADTIEWNISKVRAPEVWAAGYTGQGITVAGQDTGYEWDHLALKEAYRGWDGASANHNYNWHDAIYEIYGSSCASDGLEPCDDNGHGTHTMGTMVGDDPSHNNQIGMAPGAEWIGCRNMDGGVGSPASYSECYQWFLAPTDLNDLNPDPSKAPDVINNSWSCPPSEGCTHPLVLLSVVEAVRAAGILTVHSAGNKGQEGCSSIDAPAAIYDASFTVGNTTSSDTIASSSSRGPVIVDGSGRLKPDISAPGSLVRSSYLGGGYRTLSGTSMAGPHVAGLAALLFSAQPGLIGQVDQVEQMITSTAVPISVSESCGGIPGTEYPNNISGWGRIDALNAFLSGRFQLFLPWISRE
jgi:subtilisin family serine protease